MHDLSGRYCRCCGYNIWGKGNNHINNTRRLDLDSYIFCFTDSRHIFYVFFMLSFQYFNLKLSQFGPYRVDYSKTGRSVLLDGRDTR